MALVKGKWIELLKPGLEMIWMEIRWAEEIRAGDRKVRAEVLEEAIHRLEQLDAHHTSP